MLRLWPFERPHFVLASLGAASGVHVFVFTNSIYEVDLTITSDLSVDALERVVRNLHFPRVYYWC